MALHHPELCPPPPEPESPSLAEMEGHLSAGSGPFGPSGGDDAANEDHLDVVSAGDALLACDRDTSENILSFINFKVCSPPQGEINFAGLPPTSLISALSCQQDKADLLSRMDPAKVGIR